MCQAGKGYSLWLSKSHDREHPDATARCDDREFAVRASRVGSVRRGAVARAVKRVTASAMKL